MTGLGYVLKFWKIGLVVVLAGALLLSCHARDEALRREGEMRQQLVQLRAKAHRDSIAERAANVVVQHDTITLAKWIVKRDTLRRTLTLTDTVAVREILAVNDSTVHQCRETVKDLVLSCAKKDTVIADLRSILRLRAADASTTKATRSFSLGTTAGYGGTLSEGRFYRGPSLTVGITWRPF